MRTLKLFLIAVCLIALGLVVSCARKTTTNVVKVGGPTYLITSTVTGYRGTAFAVVLPKSKRIVVMTARHVCEGTEKGVFIMQQDNSRRHYVGTVELISKDSDICLIKPSRSLEDSNAYAFAEISPAIGDVVYSIGHPDALNLTAVAGTVTAYIAIPNFYVENTYESLLKTSFDAIPGMSGSPVVNADNEVVGIIMAKSLVDHDRAIIVPLQTIRRLVNDK